MVGEAFTTMNARFDRVEARLDKHDQILKEILQRMEKYDEKFDHLYSVIDSHMKRIEEIVQENAMRDRQQDRMQQWIFQLADAAGIKLKYEQ